MEPVRRERTIKLTDGRTLTMYSYRPGSWLVQARDVEEIVRDARAETQAALEHRAVVAEQRANHALAAMECFERDNRMRIAAERRKVEEALARLHRNRKRPYTIRYHLEKALADATLMSGDKALRLEANLRHALRHLETHIESLAKAAEE